MGWANPITKDPDALERAPLTAPLSALQYTVVMLLGIGYTYARIAAELKTSEWTARFHANAAAKKMPGDLPCQMRCVTWARGASMDVLSGDALRLEVVRASGTFSRSRYSQVARVRREKRPHKLAHNSEV